MSVLSTFSESFLHFVLIFRIAAVSTEKKYLIPNVFSHPFPSIEIRIETVRAFWCRSNLSGLKTILDVKRRKQVFKIVFQTGASLQISGFLSKFFFIFLNYSQWEIVQSKWRNTGIISTNYILYRWNQKGFCFQ